MVNIFDVAKNAEVSKSTVSRVFSGHGYVSKESRSKVIQAANELGYIPSILARQLQQQSTKTIGFVAQVYYPAVGELMDYVTHFAEKAGYSIMVYFTKDKAEELEILNKLKMHVLDALYFVANRNPWSVIEKFTKYGPISTWRRIKSDTVYSSYIDHYHLYKEILKYVFNTYGQVKIGHILNDPNKNNTKARLRAINEFKELHPEIDNTWQVFYPDQEGAGISAANKFMKLKDKPQVVIAYSDYVASEFIATLEHSDYVIPRNVKVFGFDNSNFGKLMHISTVDTFLCTQVQNSMNHIISKLEGKTFEEKKIVPRLLIRRTC